MQTVMTAARPAAADRFVALRGWLWLAAPAAFVVVTIVLYPLTISVKDESVYLTQAYILRAGTFFADVAHVSAIFSAWHAGHVAPVYPPGVGALLLPATLISWHAAFAVNVLLQLAGFFLFRMLLGQLGIRRGWAVLYLLYPTLVLFSRTLMSEVPSATFLLAAVALYVRGTPRSRLGAGAVLGAMGFLRYANPITALLFIAAVALREMRDARPSGIDRAPLRAAPRVIPMIAGFAAVTALLIAYDLYVFGNPFGPYPQVGHFGLGYLLPHLGLYALLLSCAWPLMFFAPLFYRGPLRLEALITTFGTLLVMSAWYYVDDVHGIAENVVTIPRLLLPVIPLWLLTYAGVLDRLTIRRGYRALLCSAVALGLIALVGSSIAHQRYLRQAVAVREFIQRHIPSRSALVVNDETSIFLGPAWSTPRFIREATWTVRRTGCAHRFPVTVVYTAKGDPADSASLLLTLQTVRRLGAEPVVHRKLNTWSVAIWQRRPCAA